LTWTALRGELQREELLDLDGFEAHAIEGCGFQAQFYQQVQTVIDSNGMLITDRLGWRMAEFPGSTTLVGFSSEF